MQHFFELKILNTSVPGLKIFSKKDIVSLEIFENFLDELDSNYLDDDKDNFVLIHVWDPEQNGIDQDRGLYFSIATDDSNNYYLTVSNQDGVNIEDANGMSLGNSPNLYESIWMTDDNLFVVFNFYEKETSVEIIYDCYLKMMERAIEYQISFTDVNRETKKDSTQKEVISKIQLPQIKSNRRLLL